MNAKFAPGRNIAMKVPAHEYDDTVAFYRDVLGLREILEQAPSSTKSVRFDFGDKVLWIDKVPSLSQAEIWLEVYASDVAGSAKYLAEHGCPRRDEIENLPEGFKGFWVSSPANIIHLVTENDAT
ncbi:MAG: hypothetical protein LC632_01060 [Xanthomonadaceae bacterium]|nr:hypothetical protein [Xanthomonadaceae bacterium]